MEEQEGRGAAPEAAATKQQRPKFDLKHHTKRVETVESWVLTSVYGRKNNLKIWRYDMKKLVKYTAFATLFTRGTIITMDITAVVNLFLMLGICCAVCVSITSFIPAEDLKELRVLPLTQLEAEISAFVPFCLGYFLKLVLAKWWDLRCDCLDKVFDAFANTFMVVSCDLHEKRWKGVRNQLAKYGFAAIELLVQAAREQEEPDRLIAPAFLTEDEWNALEKIEDLWQRPTVVWSWILRICTTAMEHNHVDPVRVNAVTMQCLKARDAMARINAHLDTQLPFAYAHLLTLLVNTQNVVNAVRSGCELAIAIANQEAFLVGKEVVSILFISILYQALLQISYMILDPFGDDVLDFPMKAYTTHLASGIDAMLEAQNNCLQVGDDGSLHRRPKNRHYRSSESQRTS